MPQAMSIANAVIYIAALDLHKIAEAADSAKLKTAEAGTKLTAQVSIIMAETLPHLPISKLLIGIFMYFAFIKLSVNTIARLYKKAFYNTFLTCTHFLFE